MEFEIVSVSIAVSDDEQLGAWDESPKHEVSRIYVCPGLRENSVGDRRD